MFFSDTDETPVEAVVRQLRDDPTTRRAVLPILAPSDVVRGSRDVPCALAMQLFIRNGSLEALLLMRSQSAAMVMPFDLFVFGALHRQIAATLGARLGSFHYVASSIHVYVDELELAERIVRGEVLGIDPGAFEADSWERLVDLDLRVREGNVASHDFKPGTFNSSIATLLCAHAMSRRGQRAEAIELLDDLPVPLKRAAALSLDRHNQ
jgi:hypothetical protein